MDACLSLQQSFWAFGAFANSLLAWLVLETLDWRWYLILSSLPLILRFVHRRHRDGNPAGIFDFRVLWRVVPVRALLCELTTMLTRKITLIR